MIDLDRFITKVNADIKGGNGAWLVFDPDNLSLHSFRQNSKSIKKIEKAVQAIIDGDFDYYDDSIPSVEFFIGVYINGRYLKSTKGDGKGERQWIAKPTDKQIANDCLEQIYSYIEGREKKGDYINQKILLAESKWITSPGVSKNVH
tara:strand:- start:2521 stop:2961 length:441 start_codon:yes stop_codon:yes gene_type:complete